MSKALPEIKVNLDGIEYTGIFSTKAFCLLEEQTGKNALSGETWANVNVSTITLILWAALKTKYPDITIDFIRDRLAIEDLKLVMDQVSKGFLDASPPQVEATEEKKIAE